MAKEKNEKPATTLGGAPVTLFGTFPSSDRQRLTSPSSIKT